MKIIFAGTPSFAAGYLEALIADDHDVPAVITRPDRLGKRRKQLLASPVKRLAKAAGLNILQPEQLSLADIESIDCDLMIVVAYGDIIRQSVLDHPRLGSVNVHASLLPRWRGAAPVQRALLAGDSTAGITLIQMDAGLDTGDMLASAEVPIDDSDSAADVLGKLAGTGQDLLIKTLAQLAAGNITPVPQNPELVTYAHKIDKQEALLDWQAGATLVDRKVRAFNPSPVAWSFLGKLRVRIHAGRVTATARGKAGSILDVTRDGILVGCGEDAFLVTHMQLPLGKGSVLTGADMLNGRTDILYPGACFSTSPQE